MKKFVKRMRKLVSRTRAVKAEEGEAVSVLGSSESFPEIGRWPMWSMMEGAHHKQRLLKNS